MWLLRNCRGGRSCAPLHAGLEAARLKHLAAVALRAGGRVVRLVAGSSARPDVEAVGSSGHRSRPYAAPEHDVLRGRFRRLRLVRRPRRG